MDQILIYSGKKVLKYRLLIRNHKVQAASNFRSSIFVQITFKDIFHNPNTENSLKNIF